MASRGTSGASSGPTVGGRLSIGKRSRAESDEGVEGIDADGGTDLEIARASKRIRVGDA